MTKIADVMIDSGQSLIAIERNADVDSGFEKVSKSYRDSVVRSGISHRALIDPIFHGINIVIGDIQRDWNHIIRIRFRKLIWRGFSAWGFRRAWTGRLEVGLEHAFKAKQSGKN